MTSFERIVSEHWRNILTKVAIKTVSCPRGNGTPIGGGGPGTTSYYSLVFWLTKNPINLFYVCIYISEICVPYTIDSLLNNSQQEQLCYRKWGPRRLNFTSRMCIPGIKSGYPINHREWYPLIYAKDHICKCIYIYYIYIIFLYIYVYIAGANKPRFISELGKVASEKWSEKRQRVDCWGFDELNKAYNVLSDQQKRQRYDEKSLGLQRKERKRLSVYQIDVNVLRPR
jgi:hypothetical protein